MPQDELIDHSTACCSAASSTRSSRVARGVRARRRASSSRPVPATFPASGTPASSTRPACPLGGTFILVYHELPERRYTPGPELTLAATAGPVRPADQLVLDAVSRIGADGRLALNPVVGLVLNALRASSPRSGDLLAPTVSTTEDASLRRRRETRARRRDRRFLPAQRVCSTARRSSTCSRGPGRQFTSRAVPQR